MRCLKLYSSRQAEMPSSPRSGQSGLEQSKDTGIFDQVARMAESFFSILACVLVQEKAAFRNYSQY